MNGERVDANCQKVRRRSKFPEGRRAKATGL